MCDESKRIHGSTTTLKMDVLSANEKLLRWILGLITKWKLFLSETTEFETKKNACDTLELLPSEARII